MNLNSFTKILLLIYGLSIVGNSFMEVGHDVLHRIENTFHHHGHEHYHSVEDHHVNLDAEDSAKNDIEAMSDLCSFFLYFEKPFRKISLLSLIELY